MRCSRYPGGGGVWPSCHPGSAGRTRDSIFVTVPGTHTRTNIANLPGMWAFLDAARGTGHAVDANGDYGSARTRAMQDYLYRNGYPANPPGKSTHEWGLAIALHRSGVASPLYGSGGEAYRRRWRTPAGNINRSGSCGQARRGSRRWRPRSRR